LRLRGCCGAQKVSLGLFLGLFLAGNWGRGGERSDPGLTTDSFLVNLATSRIKENISEKVKGKKE